MIDTGYSICVSGSSKVVLSGNGDIVFLNLQNKSLGMQIPLYFLIFEEHAFYNPGCQHLTGSSHIEITEETNDSVSFKRMFEEVELQCSIGITDDALHIEARLEDSASPIFNFGIVVPVIVPVTSAQEEINFPLARYFRSFERLYRNQQQLTLPIVTFPHHESYLSAYLPPEYNSTFFTHEQNGQTCVRITTSAKQTKTLDVWLRCHDSKDEISTIYSNSFIAGSSQPWRSEYESLGSKYGIEIVYGQSNPRLSDELPWFQWRVPTNNELTRFLPILKQETDRYPTSFFRDIELSRVILAGDIQNLDDKNVDGIQPSNDVVLDISNSTSKFYLRRIIHHEIFHKIESRMPPVGEIDHAHLISHLAKNDSTQTRAEIFSLLMVNPGLLASRSSGDERITHEIESIKDITKKHGIFNSQPVVITEKPAVKKSSCSTNMLRDRYFILGYPHSGFNLTCSIISCSGVAVIMPSILPYLKEKAMPTLDIGHLVEHFDSYFSDTLIKRVYGHPVEKQLDIDLLSNIEDSQIIWLTRHPMDICSGHTSDLSSAEAMMKQWLKVNDAVVSMFGDRLFHLKYEDVILKKSRLSEFFVFLGVQFSEQYERYGDFDMPVCVKSNNPYLLEGFINKDALHHTRRPKYLNDLWANTWQHTIIERAGYSNQQLEE